MIQIIIKYGRPIVLAIKKSGSTPPPIISWIWGTITGTNWGTSTPDKLWGVPESTTAPANLTAPTITGAAIVGQTLTINGGTWSAVPYILKYDIYRGATLLTSLATSNSSISYTLVQTDAGNTSNIKCTVSAINSAGTTSADSNTIVRILDTLTNNYITGLTLTSGEIDSFNTLYLALRSNNYHTEIDRLNIYGSATQAASNKSLFGSFTATPINSPTWSRKVGYTHTGTSYLTTGYTPSINSVKATLNNNSYIVGFNNLPNTADSMLGGATSSGLPSGLSLYSVNINLLIRSYATGNITAFTNRLLSDTYAAIVRTSSTSITGYLNSATSINASTVNNPIVDLEIFEGARNLSGVASLPMVSGSISRYGCIGSANINPVTFNTIVQNFIASL